MAALPSALHQGFSSRVLFILSAGFVGDPVRDISCDAILGDELGDDLATGHPGGA
jgi:hypothetical protein